MTLSDQEVAPYFRGQKLYGDDFSREQILQWFADEQEGYANIKTDEQLKEYKYPYHAMNAPAFDCVKGDRLDVLSIGGAFGEEVMPLKGRMSSLTIVEPSQKLRQSHLGETPITYVDPDPFEIPIHDREFDVITCFSTLHHIPNVSHTVKEMYRLTKPGGLTLIREPIVSMGDWRTKRSKLTTNERGIPVKLLDRMMKDAGYLTTRKILYNVPPVSRFVNDAYNSSTYCAFDRFLASVMRFNYRYHRVAAWQKFCPTIVLYALQKPSNEG